MATSARVLTVVPSVAELLSWVGRRALGLTLFPYTTLFRSDGSTLTTRVSVLVAPGFMSPSVQFTVPAVLVPPLSAETKLVPEGSGSDTDTERATDGPLFVTTMV